MSPEEHLHHLAIRGDQLSEIAATADPTTPVPSCGDWDLRQLITHCAQVWSFVAQTVRQGGPTGSDSSVMEPTSPVLSEWHAAAVTDVHHLLESLGPDAEVWTWAAHVKTARFWMRRMAQEAVIHLWDAQDALGQAIEVEPALAVDGIDELLDHFIGDRNPTCFAGNGETVHFHATDAEGEWVITRTETGIEVERTHAKGDVAARGPAHDLLLMVWGRKVPEDLEVFGDIALLHEWQQKVRF